MADQSIKIIEGKGGLDIQVEIDAFIATLNSGYDILEVTLCQAGSSLSSKRIVLALKYTDGSA